VSDKEPVFSVIIDAQGVALRRIKPGRPGYRKARKAAIVRQRDAIDLYQKTKAEGARFAGRYSFRFLDTAKTFAMLRLEAMEHAIQDNLDRVQAYDGSSKSSDR
jgi:hypothetical protein